MVAGGFGEAEVSGFPVAKFVLENKIEFAAATLGMYYWLNRYFCEKSEI